jgi:uncharacterized protein
MVPLLIIAVFAVSIIFSMLGLGGGALYVPILLQSGMPFNGAVATSLSIILVMSLTAAVVYHAHRLIDWKVIISMEPFSVLGASIGSYNSNLFPERSLYILFAAVMVVSAVFMLVPNTPLKVKPADRFGFIHGEKNGEYYAINLWVGIPVSFLAGFVSSILGIGGGFAKVPMMTLLFGMPIKVAVASSSAMIVITALAGLIGHSLAGHVNLKIMLISASVVFFGAIIGSRISVKADKKFLNRVFAVVQVLVAGYMAVKAINL